MLAIDPATQSEIARFAFDAAQLGRFAARVRRATVEDNTVRGVIAPTEPEDASLLPAPGSRERAALEARGREAVRAGHVGVVVLAGGMATRFGGVVKAAVSVTHGRSFLDLKLGDATNVARSEEARVPAYVMTSFATHDRIEGQIVDERLTRSAEGGAECFAQCVSLRLGTDGALFREDDGTLSPYATGHGDLTFALRNSGVLSRFRADRGRLLAVSNVDNLGATLDLAVLGAHLESRRAITAEVVRKEKGDRGGAPARVDGRAQIIEAFRFPEAFAQDSIPLFNTNTFVMDAEAVDRDFDLTFFRVEKKVGGRTAIQFERLVGELTSFLPTHFLEVERSGPDGRFQPAKDPEELERRLPDIEAILRARGVIAR